MAKILKREEEISKLLRTALHHIDRLSMELVISSKNTENEIFAIRFAGRMEDFIKACLKVI